MDVKILGKKSEGKATCILCETSLLEYVEALDSKYKKYDVQRGIVKNIYLDRLSDTLFEKGHIPPIVLVTSKNFDEPRVGQKVSIKSFNILDGLQRTFRIKRIWDSGLFIFGHNISSKMTRSMLLRDYGKEMERLDIDPSEILKLQKKIENLNITESIFRSFFSDNFVWIEIWSNLNKNQQIGKMLTLNAGHKPMQKRHQLELLFLNLEQIFEEEGLEHSDDFKVIREKDMSVTLFQKHKTPYHFHLSILIASVISFVEGKVIIPGVSLVKEIQEQGASIIEGEDDLNIDELFKDYFYEPFINFIIKVDEVASKDEDTLKWLARETVMPGILAALGKLRIEKELTIENSFGLLLQIVKKNGFRFFNVKEFESVRANIPVQKVNVGKHLRDLVFNGVYDSIENSRTDIRWKYIQGKMK